MPGAIKADIPLLPRTEAAPPKEPEISASRKAYAGWTANVRCSRNICLALGIIATLGVIGFGVGCGYDASNGNWGPFGFLALCGVASLILAVGLFGLTYNRHCLLKEMQKAMEENVDLVHPTRLQEARDKALRCYEASLEHQDTQRQQGFKLILDRLDERIAELAKPPG